MNFDPTRWESVGTPPDPTRVRHAAIDSYRLIAAHLTELADVQPVTDEEISIYEKLLVDVQKFAEGLDNYLSYLRV